MTTVVTRSSVILGDSKDWNKWIKLIKTAALRSDIWLYINPDTPENRLPIQRRPVRPTPGNVHENDNPLIKYSQLNKDEKEQLKVLQRDYEYDRKRFDEQENALNDIRTRIQETIKRGFLTYTFKCNTAYKMLVNLKNRFAPSDSAREQELVLKWKKLQNKPQNQNVNIWLHQWETLYDECKAEGLPNVQGNRPIQAFLDAISTIAPSFADT
jgi:hypothetical protein